MSFLIFILLGKYYIEYSSFNYNNEGEIELGLKYSKAYIAISVAESICNNCILIYSVHRIRSIIMSKDYIDPNEKFAFIHMINFFIDSILQVI